MHAWDVSQLSCVSRDPLMQPTWVGLTTAKCRVYPWKQLHIAPDVMCLWFICRVRFYWFLKGLFLSEFRYCFSASFHPFKTMSQGPAPVLLLSYSGSHSQPCITSLTLPCCLCYLLASFGPSCIRSSGAAFVTETQTSHRKASESRHQS